MKNIKFSGAEAKEFKKSHMMTSRPKGWVIMDSVNNPFFSSTAFDVDTQMFDLEKLKVDLYSKYGGSIDDIFLPWHYTIDIVNTTPYVIQTRPPMYKGGIPAISNYMSILIIGNSEVDLYNGKFYKTIAHNIINPWKFIPSVRIPNDKHNFKLFVKENFNLDYLIGQLH